MVTQIVDGAICRFCGARHLLIGCIRQESGQEAYNIGINSVWKAFQGKTYTSPNPKLLENVIVQAVDFTLEKIQSLYPLFDEIDPLIHL